MANAEIYFGVDRTSIRAGECVTFHWKVEAVREVYFYREGERWQDHGVTGEERRQECPPANATYNLRVVKRDGSVEMRQIGIQVQAGSAQPNIQRFGLTPSGQINAGECVDIQWHVAGDVRQVRVLHDRGTLWDAAPLQGQLRDCPNVLGQVTYSLEASGPGGTSRVQQSIRVVSQRPVEPPPTQPPPPPPPDKAIIEAFTVTPERIQVGGIVTVTWRAGGATSWINIFRGEHMIKENAPLSGSMKDSPRQPGEKKYRIIAYNPQDKRVRQDRIVTVTG